ncbi:hypothetical protein [Kitasatospora sp. NPDC050543]|uniref:hypothetical protein n=1 Tax=Kitasatospora sp. NPDC050543 TaxID=3364054 RepID=UPI0037A5BD94
MDTWIAGLHEIDRRHPAEAGSDGIWNVQQCRHGRRRTRYLAMDFIEDIQCDIHQQSAESGR